MRKNIVQKIISCVMVMLLLTSAITVIAVDISNNDVIGNFDYIINNPYSNVDWNNWTAYKAATHVHSNISDGKIDFADMIEKYYELGYDGLAITDHGTVNTGWTKEKSRLTVFQYQAISYGSPKPLSVQRYNDITSGVGRNGRGMLEIPYGIELNGASLYKCHVNSYFADCGNGDLGLTEDWPEEAVAKSNYNGGISHINHIGEWSGGMDGTGAYNDEFVSDLAEIFKKYRSCVGMELVNKSDSRTKNDRYLYDKLLQKLAPLGINLYGFCEDDSHEFEDCAMNAQIMMMPSNSVNNVKKCLLSGTFFACSKNAKTSAELGDGFNAVGDFPSVNRIDVDEFRDKISISCANATKVKMVSNGVILETADVSIENGEAVFDLNSYEDSIGDYVRFYLTGPGGICYAQPFLLTKSPYSVCTVTFNLPSNDTVLIVKDSFGNIMLPENNKNKFILAEGDYTYSASREGKYTKLTDMEFTVTHDDIMNGVQIKIDVNLDFRMDFVNVYLSVPETIYLDTASGKTSNFKYYLDKDLLTNKLNNTPGKPDGNVFIYCEDAESISLKAELSGGLQNIASDCGDLSKGCTVDNNIILTKITAGAVTEPVEQGKTVMIKWTATIKHNTGEIADYHAYSAVYSPLQTEAAAGIRHVHTHSTDVFNQGILWVNGINSVFGGDYLCNKNFFTDSAPSSNSGISSYFTGLTNGGSSFGSYEHSSNEADTHTVTSGLAQIYVDTSRFTNLNQLPNLNIGYWQCDIEGDESATGYVRQKINGVESALCNINGGVGCKYKSYINFENKKNTVGTRSLTFEAFSQTLRGSRQNNNYYNVLLKINYVDKSLLREKYDKVMIRGLDKFDCTKDEYAAYSQAVYNAAAVLGSPDATHSEIEAASTSLDNVLQQLDVLLPYAKDSDTDTFSDTDSAVDSSTDSMIDSDSESQSDTSTDTESDTSIDSSTDSVVDFDTSSDTFTDTDTNDFDTDTEIVVSDTDTLSEIASDTDNHTDTSSDTTDSTADTYSDTDSMTDIDSTTDTERQLIIGDANCDGKINMLDVTTLQRILAELDSFEQYSVFAKSQADVNNDLKINLVDVVEIQKYMAGLDSALKPKIKVKSTPHSLRRAFVVCNLN